MALTDAQKRHYAWEFLRRSPAYRDFWEAHQAAMEAANETKSKWPRRQARERLLARQCILRDDGRRAMGQWGLSRVADPHQALDSLSLKGLFRRIVPVTPFFDAPWSGDTRLYLAIDPHSSLEAIDQALHVALKQHKGRLGIPQRERKKPRARDLEYYLAILDHYRAHLSGLQPEASDKRNYGYTKGWAKLAKAGYSQWLWGGRLLSNY